jgi:hypothetical protein
MAWYLLIHRLPVRPLYFRARIRRMLGEAGAVALKKAVYALPRTAGALERLSRIAEDIRAGGGEAFVCEAAFTSKQDEAALVAAARRERAADYARIARDARALRASNRAAPGAAAERARAGLERIRVRLEGVRAIDPAPSADDAGARAAIGAIEDLQRALQARSGRIPSSATPSLVGYTWVTRRGLHIDRLACAWVVRRFVDPGAAFRFADPNDLRAGPGELTFDMPGGDFSHDEGRCSVETLLARAGVDDSGARRIAEIVHDLDLKDERFGHPETAGVERLVAGIVEGHPDDRSRLERGLALFDDLHRSYVRPKRLSLRLGRAPEPPPRRP